MKILIIGFFSTLTFVVNAQKTIPVVGVEGFHYVQFTPNEVFIYFTVEDKSRIDGDRHVILKEFDQCVAELKGFLKSKDSTYNLISVESEEAVSASGGVSETFKLVVRDHEIASGIQAETYNLDGVRVVHPVSHFSISRESLWDGMMEMAIKDAYRKATKLAQMVGMKLSRVVEIGDYRFDDVFNDTEETTEKLIYISCTVRVKYEMEK